MTRFDTLTQLRACSKWPVYHVNLSRDVAFTEASGEDMTSLTSFHFCPTPQAR